MESNNNVQVTIDENGWIIGIKECLEVQEEEKKELCVSVFNVPKELLAVKPEAYIPQCISIGPYHHWRSELYNMERYKLAAARRFQKRIQGLGMFESVVVEEFKKHEWQIRSCYHKFIDYKEETLSWLMALDAAFLLECLQFYVRHADQSSHSDFKHLGSVLDPNATRAVHNSIVRDLMMLENQLPVFLLQKLLELQLGSRAKAEERLSRLLRLVCEELSPFSFKLPETSNLHINEGKHLLEVLYYAIVPVFDNQNSNAIAKGNDAPATTDMSTVTHGFCFLWKALSSIKFGPLRFLTKLPRRAVNTRPVQFVMKLPLRLLSTLGNLPVLRAIKKPLAVLVKIEKKEEEGVGEGSSVNIIPPSRDELDIPSVTNLYSAGVNFSPTDGDLTTIQFNQKTATLHLPKVKLDTNTEVILRNLVAFEASAAPGALVFTRYTDFMNGMIDSEEDVRLLRKCGIISNHLQGDGEVASLWNSMGKCVRLTKVGYLDRVIKDVNQYYYKNWKVIAVEFVNNRIFGSWKFLSFLAAVIFLAVTCLQSFCSVYNCNKWFDQSSFLKD
jgi:hypothetical protein